jgi:hypothetical protein
MVMSDEVLRKLVSGVFITACNTVNHTDALEVRQISVDRTLGKSRPMREELGNTGWMSNVEQHVDELSPSTCIDQIALSQPHGDFGVDAFFDSGHCDERTFATGTRRW